MRFGEALEELNSGEKVCRKNWNGKNMFLFAISDWDFRTDIECDEIIDENGDSSFDIEDMITEPFICLKTAQNTLMAWNPNNLDMLAEDWEIVK